MTVPRQPRAAAARLRAAIRALDAAPRDRAARRRHLQRRRPSGHRAAQRPRADPARPAAVQARRRPVPDDHAAHQRQHPPAGQRAGAAARRARQPGRATGRGDSGAARRRWPSSRRMPPSEMRCWRSPATTTPVGTRYREQVLVPRKSLARPARGVSVLRAAVRGLPRHAAAAAAALLLDLVVARWSRRTAAASPSAWSRDRRAAGTGSSRASCSNYLARSRSTHRLRLHPQADIPFHPPENPHLPMIMVGPGHGRGAVPRLPAGARGAEAAGRAGRRVAAVLRLPRSAAGLPLRGRAAGVRGGGVTRLLAAFSREPGKPKTYVQQAIREHGRDVWRCCSRRR